MISAESDKVVEVERLPLATNVIYLKAQCDFTAMADTAEFLQCRWTLMEAHRIETSHDVHLAALYGISFRAVQLCYQGNRRIG